MTPDAGARHWRPKRHRPAAAGSTASRPARPERVHRRGPAGRALDHRRGNARGSLLTLPEKLFLLAFDPAAGRLARRSHLGTVLRAAALLDLQLAGYLADGGGRVEVVRAGSPADPVLAGLLTEIRRSRPRKWRYWIDRKHSAIVRATRAELGRRRLIGVERRRRFGLVPTYRLTLREPLVRRRLLTAAHETLRSAGAIHRMERANAALAVLAATAELRPVISKEQRKRHKERLDQLAAQLGPVVPALKKSIQAAQAASSSGG